MFDIIPFRNSNGYCRPVNITLCKFLQYFIHGHAVMQQVISCLQPLVQAAIPGINAKTRALRIKPCSAKISAIAMELAP